MTQKIDTKNWQVDEERESRGKKLYENYVTQIRKRKLSVRIVGILEGEEQTKGTDSLLKKNNQWELPKPTERTGSLIPRS